VDLPGTYSLEAADNDEQVTAAFLKKAQPDVTIVVADATALERTLLLCLQVAALQTKVIVAVNLIDEAEGRGIGVDFARLSAELGLTVVPMAARRGQGVADLRRKIAELSLAVPAKPVPGNGKLPDSEDLYRRAGEIVKACVTYRPAPKHSLDWRAALDWSHERWTAFR
jgi:Fe2+ transport system protein B